MSQEQSVRESNEVSQNQVQGDTDFYLLCVRARKQALEEFEEMMLEESGLFDGEATWKPEITQEEKLDAAFAWFYASAFELDTDAVHTRLSEMIDVSGDKQGAEDFNLIGLYFRGPTSTANPEFSRENLNDVWQTEWYAACRSGDGKAEERSYRRTESYLRERLKFDPDVLEFALNELSAARPLFETFLQKVDASEGCLP